MYLFGDIRIITNNHFFKGIFNNILINYLILKIDRKTNRIVKLVNILINTSIL